jgi:hypothetical protein
LFVKGFCFLNMHYILYRSRSCIAIYDRQFYYQIEYFIYAIGKHSIMLCGFFCFKCIRVYWYVGEYEMPCLFIFAKLKFGSTYLISAKLNLSAQNQFIGTSSNWTSFHLFKGLLVIMLFTIKISYYSFLI